MEKLPGANVGLHQCKPEIGTITATSYSGDLDQLRIRTPVVIQLVVTLLAGLVAANGGIEHYLNWNSPVIAAEPLPATAVPNLNLLPSMAPLDVAALKMEPLPPPLRSATTISRVSLTIPSLWWTEEHHAAQDPSEARLVENWLAYPLTNDEPGRVDVVVNRQLWSLLDYLERYEFINEFGSGAKDFGYNLRVFDNRAQLLGAYTCDFSHIDLVELQNAQRSLQPPLENDGTKITISTLQRPTTLICDVTLDSSGKASFRGR